MQALIKVRRTSLNLKLIEARKSLRRPDGREFSKFKRLSRSREQRPKGLLIKLLLHHQAKSMRLKKLKLLNRKDLRALAEYQTSNCQKKM
jgi:hypothetical protein